MAPEAVPHTPRLHTGDRTLASMRRHALVAGAFGVCIASVAFASSTAAAEPYVAVFRAAQAVESGERVEVSGRVSPAASVTVLVQRRRADGTWVLAKALRAGRNGAFAGRVPLAASGSLRALVKRTSGEPSISRRRAVTVRRAIELLVVPPHYQEIAGVAFRVEGLLRPAARGEKVTIEGSRGGAFRPIGTLPVRPGGAIRGTVKVPAGGSWRVRIRAGATPGGQAGATAVTLPFTVHGRNPHRVPRSAANYIVQARSRFQLFYYEKGRLVRVFPVVFGAAATPTPLGRYRVYSKTVGPRAAFGPLVLWYHRGYGIHGTNQESLLSYTTRYYSHGCTRNYNDNIRWLWPRVPIGTPVVNVA